ncbi:hypothetical protein E1B28_012008 [Marasmius oreades]|uniref:Uncharacterized protein n=1 Tax=Marasmius oreades TaxID=181124 RepID=A0A9P7RR63_9AGAR|nr:uncharacterized protein E1B28_012008 [Marasmius oreades]KAG7087967.1 hypothetical protein E1B28_012008 [Marasmius oreades]
MGSSARAQNISLGDNSTFIIAGQDVVHNYNNDDPTDVQLAYPHTGSSIPRSTSPGKLTVLHRTLVDAKEKGFEEVGIGKIIVREDVSSKSLVVRLKPTNPFQSSNDSLVKIRRTVQFAEIDGENIDRRFTVLTLDSEDGDEDEGVIWKLWKQVYEKSSFGPRKAYLPQLFGLCRSSKPALVYHQELVGGEDIIEEYAKIPIVFAYLWYIHVTSYRAIFEDGVVKKYSIPLSEHYRNWIFNLSTRSWVYDITSIALSDVEDDSPHVFFDNPPFLPRHCNPRLASGEILRDIPDYLSLVSTLKSKPNVEGFKDFLRQGILRFGAVIDRTNPVILAHFPVVPSPQWYHKSMNPEIESSYSKSVPSRLDLTFVKKSDHVRLNLRFSLRLPLEARQRLRVAYLTQTTSVDKDEVEQSDLVLVEEIRFKLAGDFTSDPSSHKPPIHLFVPPPAIEWANGAPFIRWPLRASFYYWSFDPKGRDPIAKEDWHQYGIPTLKVKDAWIGSSWPKELYEAARDYLALSSYGMDGERFASENGYPILVKGDPHSD